MRVLVTGGTGFIGSHIVEKLLDEGHDVVVAKRPASNLQWLPVKDIQLVDAPAENLHALEIVLPSIEVVIHVAGITRANSREDFFRINADAVEKLLYLCDKYASKMKKFVLISSLSAAGFSENEPLDETMDESPFPAYGESKRRGEKEALKYKERFEVAILRPPTVYGPRETGVYVYFKLINRGILPFIDTPERKISAIYVKDLAKAAVMLLDADYESGSAYFISDGEIYTWRDFANQIAKELGKKPLKLTIPAFLGYPVAAFAELGSRVTGKPALLSFDRIRMLKVDWTCDSALLECEIGFVPDYDLERGIHKTVEWYRENGWL